MLVSCCHLIFAINLGFFPSLGIKYTVTLTGDAMKSHESVCINLSKCTITLRKILNWFTLYSAMFSMYSNHFSVLFYASSFYKFCGNNVITFQKAR